MKFWWLEPGCENYYLTGVLMLRYMDVCLVYVYKSQSHNSTLKKLTLCCISCNDA